ncbi:MAG TPA: ABC transporter permease, partial [Rhodothermia bacterium]|nr:ABC transporter permease [Rhodothermia bacterium]
MIARDEIETKDARAEISGALTRGVSMPRARGAVRVLLNHHGLIVGGSICTVLLVLAIFAPLFATMDPKAISMTDRLLAPTSTHLMGTDHLGRDIWSRVLYGARISMFVGLSVATTASLTGIIVGLVGGYSRRFGSTLMRLVDGLLAFPGIVLALALIAVLGSRLSNVIIALSIVYLPRVARIMHGVVLELREREYIMAATAMGAKTVRVLVRHILPNSMGPAIVQGSFIFASAIITEASLSFLGLGLP